MLIGLATFKPFNSQLTEQCLGAVLSSVCKHAQVSHYQLHLILVPVRAINKAYCELYCYIAKINQHSLFQFRLQWEVFNLKFDRMQSVMD